MFLTGDEALHLLGGMAFGKVMSRCGVPAPITVGMAAIFGIGREWFQHWNQMPWEFSSHVWREALAWPLGSFFASGL